MADAFFNKRRHFGPWQQGSAMEAASKPVLGFGTALAIVNSAVVFTNELCPAPRRAGQERGRCGCSGPCAGEGAAGRNPRCRGHCTPAAPTPHPSCCNADRDLRSAQTISGCLLSFFASHAGCFSPTHLPLHLLHLSHSLTSLEKNNPLEIDAIPKSRC